MTAPLALTPEDIARRHLEAWAGELLGGRRTLALTGAERDGTLPSALAGAAEWEALSWLDAPADELPLELLRAAADAGVRIVLAVRGLGPAAAERLAAGFGGVVAGRQLLVQGSLIVGPGEPPPHTSAALDDGARADDAGVHRVLLAGNVDVEEAARVAGAMAQLTLDSVYRTQLERLEEAYWSLRRANSRLARENLGRHDAAAASVVGRLSTELAATKRQLEIEIEVARRNDEYFQAARAKLGEPHHRAAERLYQMLSAVPGGRALSRRALSRGR